MNTVLIPPGPGGYGKGLWLPVASGKKVLSLTGREIHPVAIEIGALTESEVVNGFSDIPPDNDIRHCCKVSDEAAFCLIQRPYISKTLLTRRISPRGSP